jgi:hypothetical protein
MFALWEINQMEQEMCSYLEWQLNMNPSMLRDFQNRVQRDASVIPSPSIIVGQGMFALREINQMEREMCSWSAGCAAMCQCLVIPVQPFPPSPRTTTFTLTSRAKPFHRLRRPHLQRLKARFPIAKGSSGHRLFIAVMLASKIM